MLFALQLHAQFPLPFYELWDSSSLIISRDTAQFTRLMRDLDHLLAVGPMTMRTVPITGFRFATEDECCNDDDPTYLIADLAEHIDTSHWSYLPVVPLDQEFIQARPLDRVMLPDTMDPLTVEGGEYHMRWVWLPDGTEQRPQMQRIRPDGSLEGTWDWLTARRSGCRATAVGELTWVDCPGRFDSTMMITTPGLNILLAGASVVHVFLDMSNTTIDGWGPFHWAHRRPLALLTMGGAQGLVLDSGEVLLNEAGQWRLAHREPVRYYGECDCPED